MNVTILFLNGFQDRREEQEINLYIYQMTV
jgi:hypothetical protein